MRPGQSGGLGRPGHPRPAAGRFVMAGRTSRRSEQAVSEKARPVRGGLRETVAGWTEQRIVVSSDRLRFTLGRGRDLGA